VPTSRRRRSARHDQRRPPATYRRGVQHTRPAPSSLDATTEITRVRVRVSRPRSRWKRHIRRWGPRASLSVLLLLVLAAGWVAVRGLEARRDLQEASSNITQVRLDLLSADSTQAQADLTGAAQEANSARNATHDPIWSLVSHVPVIGRPVRAVAGIAQLSSDLTDGPLPVLVRTAGVVSSQRIAIAHGRVDLTELGAQAAPLAGADATVAGDAVKAQALPSGFVGTINAARDTLRTQLASLSAEVHAAAVTAAIGPGMLGGNGPRNYFVAFQDSAEARGTGGIAGAYVILHADQGQLSVTGQGSDADLRDNLPPVSTVPTGVAQRFVGAGVSSIWRDANVGADFSTAGDTWATLWQEQTGQRLDGAFAVDPTVLSYLLGVTGPATLSNGQTVTAANAVALTEQTVYANFGTARTNRQSFLQLVSSATIHKALAAPGTSGRALLEALRQAAGQNRLLIYSAVPAEEQALVTTPVGGALPPTSAPTAVMTLVNASGNKIDYYVSSNLSYRAHGCSATGRTVTVTIQVTNNAPTSGLSSVVTTRLDGGHGPAGSEVSLLSYYATTGAQVLSATLDGAPTTVDIAVEAGHPVFGLSLTLLPGGRTSTVVLHLQEPVLPGPVQTRPQALVQPQRVTISAPTCG
jgi:hypothetical protein